MIKNAIQKSIKATTVGIQIGDKTNHHDQSMILQSFNVANTIVSIQNRRLLSWLFVIKRGIII